MFSCEWTEGKVTAFSFSSSSKAKGTITQYLLNNFILLVFWCPYILYLFVFIVIICTYFSWINQKCYKVHSSIQNYISFTLDSTHLSPLTFWYSSVNVPLENPVYKEKVAWKEESISLRLWEALLVPFKYILEFSNLSNCK